ncbi:MAG: 50S ribosomal protein L3 N(5)-glutamine methyltransferase [Gammaproteobacteria bacterium]|jgi:ribosomal protein L3 glutamine methyltransferase
MDRTELESALSQAQDCLQCVEAVDRYFSSFDLFYGHGTETPADEAYWLVWQLSGKPDELAAIAPDAALTGRIAELASRRVTERIPLAYLLGVAWFAGLEFEVGPGVLIPRSPLAEIIERRFEPWCALEDGDRVLEIGTGSGCIAVAAAVHHPGIEVDATDIDSQALATARANAVRHEVDARVRCLAADLFPDGTDRYRVIISNPPYVPTRAIESLPAEYRHEPGAALDGGADGLDVVHKILSGAGRRLTRDGVLIVEVGLAAEALVAAYPRVPWTWLEFERGGDGVFLLTAEQVRDGWG